MKLVVETPWPQVVAVKPLGNFRLQVLLKNGEQWQVDLDSLVQRRTACWRLRQERYFRQVSIDPLGALCWPEGEDLAPESLAHYRCN